jgi:Zn-dependent M16 (insulinase) family peptidase
MTATHVDYAPLIVCAQWLSQCEGPLWKQLRGRGLVYSASVSYSLDNALLTLNLYRASNAVAAYEEARSLIVRVGSREPVCLYRQFVPAGFCTTAHEH